VGKKTLPIISQKHLLSRCVQHDRVKTKTTIPVENNATKSVNFCSTPMLLPFLIYCSDTIKITHYWSLVNNKMKPKKGKENGRLTCNLPGVDVFSCLGKSP